MSTNSTQGRRRPSAATVPSPTRITPWTREPTPTTAHRLTAMIGTATMAGENTATTPTRSAVAPPPPGLAKGDPPPDSTSPTAPPREGAAVAGIAVQWVSPVIATNPGPAINTSPASRPDVEPTPQVRSNLLMPKAPPIKAATVMRATARPPRPSVSNWTIAVAATWGRSTSGEPRPAGFQPPGVRPERGDRRIRGRKAESDDREPLRPDLTRGDQREHDDEEADEEPGVADSLLARLDRLGKTREHPFGETSAPVRQFHPTGRGVAPSRSPDNGTVPHLRPRARRA